MIRVIVIDDEPVIVRNTTRLIEKDNLGFKVIATAGNGEEGLQLIYELNPGLVVVDLSMPVMGGMEMIQKLREAGNLIPIIILSGYTEFEDAKKAIGFGVLDYLVKPVNPMDIRDFLLVIKSKLLKTRKTDGRQLLQEAIFSPVSQGKSLVTKSLGKYVIMKLCIGPFQFYRNNNFETSCPIKERTEIEDILSGIDSSVEFEVISGRYHNEFVIILPVEVDDASISFGLEDIINKVFKALVHKMEKLNYITLIYSQEQTEISGLRNKLMDLDTCLYHNGIFSKDILLEASDELRDKPSFEFVEAEVKVLSNLIEPEKQEDFIHTAKRILISCKNQQATQFMLIQVVRKIFEVLRNDLLADSVDMLINECIVNSIDYEQLAHSLSILIREYYQTATVEATDNGDSESMIYKIQLYIDKHYSEKVLIQELAQQFGFNYSYLCILFKKLMDFSPNEYLIHRRIEAAKMMLSETRKLSIKDVAESVGYNDPYYFSRLFKSNTGMSPSEYKRMMKERELI